MLGSAVGIQWFHSWDLCICSLFTAFQFVFVFYSGVHLMRMAGQQVVENLGTMTLNDGKASIAYLIIHNL